MFFWPGFMFTFSWTLDNLLQSVCFLTKLHVLLNSRQSSSVRFFHRKTFVPTFDSPPFKMDTTRHSDIRSVVCPSHALPVHCLQFRTFHTESIVFIVSQNSFSNFVRRYVRPLVKKSFLISFVARLQYLFKVVCNFFFRGTCLHHKKWPHTTIHTNKKKFLICHSFVRRIVDVIEKL